jgi:hypothetical protein
MFEPAIVVGKGNCALATFIPTNQRGRAQAPVSA